MQVCFSDTFGCRRIQVDLKDLGFTNIGIKRTRRYMREMGIIAFYPRPKFGNPTCVENGIKNLINKVEGIVGDLLENWQSIYGIGISTAGVVQPEWMGAGISIDKNIKCAINLM